MLDHPALYLRIESSVEVVETREFAEEQERRDSHSIVFRDRPMVWDLDVITSSDGAIVDLPILSLD